MKGTKEEEEKNRGTINYETKCCPCVGMCFKYVLCVLGEGVFGPLASDVLRATCAHAR